MPRLEEKHYIQGPASKKIVTIGADPEFFVNAPNDADGNDAPVVITGLLGGTKKEPIKLDYRGEEGYAVQEDGVAAEVNIPPATSGDVFGARIERAMSLAMARIKMKNPRLYRSSSNEALFEQHQLADPVCSAFGCDPDYNAYDGGQPTEPISPHQVADRDTGGGWRFAAGHIHIGWTGGPPDMPPYALACFFDSHFYLPYLHMDYQNRRRKFYGEAGRFRPKPYGIEYRTPSNFWLNDPYVARMIGERAISVARMLAKVEPAFLQEAYNTIPWADVRACINNQDNKLAKNLQKFLASECALGVY